MIPQEWSKVTEASASHSAFKEARSSPALSEYRDHFG